ncbi:SDR family NAD(P)-dependent oxidoreductase, partial [Paenibacillus sp. 28ISP30-2]|nr:SDR family NAD(P)-dependent oxidoreductase [Paenibacillus sp. 28ISP30-2]
MELKNKTAIITGATKGIGKAIAEALAKEGVNLGLISRTLPDLQKLQDSLGSTYGVKVVSAV